MLLLIYTFAVLCILLMALMIIDTAIDVRERKKPHSKDHWFEPGGHLYEGE